MHECPQNVRTDGPRLGDTAADDYIGNHSRTVASLNYMYQNYPRDIVVNPLTGTIYSFSVSPMTIEKGDSALVKWTTQAGSIVTLNGENVSDTGSLVVRPLESTFYNLVADGQVHSTKSVRLEVYSSISEIPEEYSLSQNYPNPFNSYTIIEYSIPEYSFVNLEIFNILGRKVAVVVNDYKDPDNLPYDEFGSGHGEKTSHYSQQNDPHKN